VALIVTAEGFPLAYEVLPGNTSDKTTLQAFLEKVEQLYGKAERIWIMDRGIPTKKVLELMRATDPVTVAALVNDLNNDHLLNVSAPTETEYYESQTKSGLLIQFIGFFVSIIMAVGSGFAATNTMYAAVARRGREIGTLRVLGFSRGSILLSFLAESLLLSLVGGILGCLLVLPLNGLTTGIINFTTFSEVAFNFQVSPAIMATGVGFAMILGALGGFFPARSASKKEILTALREI
jgi:ABC-type antimicrobial peptide transport system permease subunit